MVEGTLKYKNIGQDDVFSKNKNKIGSSDLFFLFFVYEFIWSRGFRI